MVLLILTLFVSSAVAGDNVSAEMEKIAKQFSDFRTDRYENQPTLAVIPFQAEEKLAKRGIGLAISEMLTAKIFNMKSYKVVERAELKKVFDEQKLGLSGVVDSNNAIAVGHILGCKIIVVGNVIQLGENYQITARMIDVLTGEVLTLAYTEVDAAVLDNEAKKYVVLVPDKEAIGFFLGFSGVPIADTDKVDIPTMRLAAGFRYIPFKWMMLECAYYPEEGGDNVLLKSAYSGSINLRYAPYDYLISTIGYGIYTETYTYEFNNNKEDHQYVLNYVSAGLEVRPLKRFGVSGSLRYYMGNIPSTYVNNVLIYKPEVRPITGNFAITLNF
jgi:TolB-like protein